MPGFRFISPFILPFSQVCLLVKAKKNNFFNKRIFYIYFLSWYEDQKRDFFSILKACRKRVGVRAIAFLTFRSAAES
jgi:hypothetical protein